MKEERDEGKNPKRVRGKEKGRCGTNEGRERMKKEWGEKEKEREDETERDIMVRQPS